MSIFPKKWVLEIFVKHCQNIVPLGQGFVGHLTFEGQCCRSGDVLSVSIQLYQLEHVIAPCSLQTLVQEIFFYCFIFIYVFFIPHFQEPRIPQSEAKTLRSS